jgi:hypothetical protein
VMRGGRLVEMIEGKTAESHTVMSAALGRKEAA